MGVLARLRRAAPDAARAADLDVYGAHAGGIRIVPSLGYQSRDDTPIDQQVEANPLLFGPVWRIALRMGALPIKVYRFGDGGVKTEAPDHPAYRLLRRPNPALTRNLMISGTVKDILTNRSAAWLKVREEPDGPPVELWPLVPGTYFVQGDKRNLISHFELRVDGRKIADLPTADVIYFRLMPDRGWSGGLTPVSSLGKVGRMGGAAVGAGEDMFENGLLGRQWLKVVKDLSEPAFNRLQLQLQAARESKFKIPVLEDGAELKDLNAPDAAVLVEAIGLSKALIADTLGLPEGSEDSKSFYEEAIQPIADAIEQELERSLMPDFTDDAFPEFAFRDKLKGDPLQQAQLHQAKILSGQETPNEAREADNRSPIDGGDVLMVPLNMVPITETATDGTPRGSDSGGGLGGDEGKGTLPGTPSRAALPDVGLRAARDNWARRRQRLLNGQSQAAANRVRGVLGKEAKAIKALLSDGRSAARAGTKLPSLAQLNRIITKNDAEVARLMSGFMSQTADSTIDEAAEFVAASEVDVADRVAQVISERSQAVAERFGQVRVERIGRIIEDAVENSRPLREIAKKISDSYSDLGVGYVDGIARTEVAFAHEQAALLTWADSGVREMEVVFGGGPCSSGVCEDNASGSPYRLGENLDNVGASFDGSDSPPFHPGCTCFAVPHIEAGE